MRKALASVSISPRTVTSTSPFWATWADDLTWLRRLCDSIVKWGNTSPTLWGSGVGGDIHTWLRSSPGAKLQAQGLLGVIIHFPLFQFRLVFMTQHQNLTGELQIGAG